VDISKVVNKGFFFRKVAYTTYNISWFIEWIDFRNTSMSTPYKPERIETELVTLGELGVGKGEMHALKQEIVY
jgi:hypothetical protein